MVAVTSSTPNQTLRRLTVIVAIQWMGATLGLPLLPLFLEHRGGTPTMIGFIMASFFVAGVATQFALGHLADRFGRRRILVTSLLTYGVASMSAVASLFAESERGRAVSRIVAAQLVGIAIGPVAGVVVAVNQLGVAFFVAGLISLVAAAVAMRTDLGDADFDESPLPSLQWTPQLIGALFAASATGLAIGVYEACWSLLMHSHGASTLQIRLSWTFFSVPWVVLSGVGGWLADHSNRRIIAVAGLLNGAAFLSIYPHIHNNNLMLFIGSLESIGAALSVPSILSLMSQGAADRELGRRQGLYATCNTAALAIAAGVSGYLFTINAALPFTLMAVISAMLATSTLWWWRNVRGHVRPSA